MASLDKATTDRNATAAIGEGRWSIQWTADRVYISPPGGEGFDDIPRDQFDAMLREYSAASPTWPSLARVDNIIESLRHLHNDLEELRGQMQRQEKS